jgi:hypothetical protein
MVRQLPSVFPRRIKAASTASADRPHAARCKLEREGLVIVRPCRGRVVRSNQRLRWHLTEFERPDHTVLATSDAGETDIERQGVRRPYRITIGCRSSGALVLPRALHAGSLAGAAAAVRAAAAARSAKTEAVALTSVPMPAASVPSAVIAVQPWLGSAIC